MVRQTSHPIVDRWIRVHLYRDAQITAGIYNFEIDGFVAGLGSVTWGLTVGGFPIGTYTTPHLFFSYFDGETPFVTTYGTYTPVPVPEPSSILLFGVGALVLGAWLSRRR